MQMKMKGSLSHLLIVTVSLWVKVSTANDALKLKKLNEDLIKAIAEANAGTKYGVGWVPNLGKALEEVHTTSSKRCFILLALVGLLLSENCPSPAYEYSYEYEYRYETDPSTTTTKKPTTTTTKKTTATTTTTTKKRKTKKRTTKKTTTQEPRAPPPSLTLNLNVSLHIYPYPMDQIFPPGMYNMYENGAYFPFCYQRKCPLDCSQPYCYPCVMPNCDPVCMPPKCYPPCDPPHCHLMPNCYGSDCPDPCIYPECISGDFFGSKLRTCIEPHCPPPLKCRKPMCPKLIKKGKLQRSRNKIKSRSGRRTKGEKIKKKRRKKSNCAVQSAVDYSWWG
ncbi:uncharacterized protein LOC26514949 isoform X2 [Drosophila ananassae]|uniref:uncharacterized protein LOC26514949 isoform X2 n=1 Tax=Drosophila ananassae TaxID=7217 RepID=UPI0013A5C982|nr:uncharacterized protein LOC26514949 isoform X2 [Drosophila ananassae]